MTDVCQKPDIVGVYVTTVTIMDKYYKILEISMEKDKALEMYLAGKSIQEISDELKIPARTIRNWSVEGSTTWDSMLAAKSRAMILDLASEVDLVKRLGIAVIRRSLAAMEFNGELLNARDLLGLSKMLLEVTELSDVPKEDKPLIQPAQPDNNKGFI